MESNNYVDKFCSLKAEANSFVKIVSIVGIGYIVKRIECNAANFIVSFSDVELVTDEEVLSELQRREDELENGTWLN